MNLRRTITGAAVALGSAAVVLGLGGTAHASGADVQTQPNLDLELGKVGSVGKLASIDTDNPQGKIEAINRESADLRAMAENLDVPPVATLLGYDNPEDPSTVEAGLGIR